MALFHCIKWNSFSFDLYFWKPQINNLLHVDHWLQLRIHWLILNVSKRNKSNKSTGIINYHPLQDDLLYLQKIIKISSGDKLKSPCTSHARQIIWDDLKNDRKPMEIRPKVVHRYSGCGKIQLQTPNLFTVSPSFTLFPIYWPNVNGVPSLTLTWPNW